MEWETKYQPPISFLYALYYNFILALYNSNEVIQKGHLALSAHLALSEDMHLPACLATSAQVTSLALHNTSQLINV